MGVKGQAIIKKKKLHNILKFLIEKHGKDYRITLDEYKELVIFEKKSPYDILELMFKISDDKQYFSFILGKYDEIFNNDYYENHNSILKEFFNKIINDADLWFYDDKKELKKWVKRVF